MNKRFDFNDLFVFEMANNHQGQVEHGRRIIGEMEGVVQKHGIRGAIKFQFRQLDSFIHQSQREKSNNRNITRFLSTSLSKKDFPELVEAVRRSGLITICSPFDEASLKLIEELEIEVIKVGSCSATDWPLLEAIAEQNKPVIFSTGGLTLKDIDNLSSFFEHQRVSHAMMHCVSIYPTPNDKLQLNQIDFLRRRYPESTIGLSSHENPNELSAVQIAVAKGARIFERHVGVPTETIKLNAYSSTPEQIDRWVQAAKDAQVLCGIANVRPQPPAEEIKALNELKRGVYARHPLKPGQEATLEDVYFAMPYVEGQLFSGDWKEGIVTVKSVNGDEPLLMSNISIPSNQERQVLFDAIHKIKGMLHEARIPLGTEFKTEFSHHYGIAKFPHTGATLIECVNRDYCKKLMIVLPGQHHPSHYHKKKEETFQVLYGVLEIIVENCRRKLYPGDTQLIQQGVWHEFWSEDGTIVEEISTTHHNDDSFYEDKEINRKPRSERKTIVNNWGRYQL